MQPFAHGLIKGRSHGELLSTTTLHVGREDSLLDPSKGSAKPQLPKPCLKKWHTGLFQREKHAQALLQLEDSTVAILTPPQPLPSPPFSCTGQHV